MKKANQQTIKGQLGQTAPVGLTTPTILDGLCSTFWNLLNEQYALISSIEQSMLLIQNRSVASINNGNQDQDVSDRVDIVSQLTIHAERISFHNSLLTEIQSHLSQLVGNPM